MTAVTDIRQPKRDAVVPGVPPVRCVPGRRSGERGLADRDQQVVADFSGKYVIFLPKPGKLGFEVTYSALEAAHF
jgi:hypothetical protein